MAKVIEAPPQVGTAKAPVNAVIVSDIHAPFHSEEWLARALAFAKTAGPKPVVIMAGDTCDCNSLALHTPHVDPPTLESELDSAQAIIRRFSDAYENVYVTLGNHEFRASRALRNLTPKLFMKMLVSGLPDNVLASPRWFSWLNGNWFVTHPQRYSKIPGKTPLGIALEMTAKEGRPINVVSGHEHHRAAVTAGKLVGICNPCLQDPDITPYITAHDLSNGFHRWQLGFTHIRADGSFRVYGAEDAGELDK